MKRERKTVTPMQNAQSQIKAAYIAAFVSAGLTAILTIMSIVSGPVMGLNIFSFIDVAVVLVLALLLMKTKSRIASIILLVYYLAGQIMIRMDNPRAGLYMTVFFATLYVCGVWGTFSYHKLKKQESPSDTPPTPPWEERVR